MSEAQNPKPKALLCVALSALALAAAAAHAASFYCESTSKLVSKRVDPMTRSHKTWLTEGRLRFDEGDTFSTVVRLDMGEVWVISREKKAYVRWPLRSVAPALLEIGDTMARTVARRVTRLRFTQSVGGRPCTQYQVYLSEALCSIWVEDGSEKAFETVRGLARFAMDKMGDTNSYGSRVAIALGGLRGMPREVSIGDPKRLRLTWTTDSYSDRPIPDSVFDLPPGYEENKAVPAAFFTVPETVYFMGEVTASYFATSAAQKSRSLLPREFTLTDEELVKGFYEGKPGAELLGVLRWAEPFTFYLAPELWCYPLSGRAINLLLVIGNAYRAGGLKQYPAYLNLLRVPAN